MSFTTYAGLQDFILSYVERTATTVPNSLLDDLTVLAEERIYADVRTKELRTLVTGTYDDDNGITLPSGFIGTMSLSVEVDSTTIVPLEFAEEAQLRKISAEVGTTGGYAIYPSHFGFESQTSGDPLIKIAPDPGAKTYYLAYWDKPATLSTAINDLYTAFPGLFVFATLVELSLYLQDWEMYQIMIQQYQDRVSKVNSLAAGDRDESMGGTAPPQAWRS